MKILIASPIDADAVTALEREHDVVQAFDADADQLRSAAADREVLVFRSGVRITEQVLRGAPNLELLLRAGSGLDNVDVAAATRRGVEVVRVPGSSAQPVAEFTFALLLCLARQVATADRELRRGHWPKAALGGPLLTGKTLGIVGAGRIGGRVGEMGAAWGMRAIGCVGSSPASRAGLEARGVELVTFDTVVAEADFLCLHVPLRDATRHLVGAGVLARMKRGAYLVNVARGGVVDEAALYRELTAGDRLAGAALDVHEREGEGVRSPFEALPNVVLTPHIGAMALDAQRLIGERVVELVSAHRKRCLRETLDPEEIVGSDAG